MYCPGCAASPLRLGSCFESQRPSAWHSSPFNTWSACYGIIRCFPFILHYIQNSTASPYTGNNTKPAEAPIPGKGNPLQGREKAGADKMRTRAKNKRQEFPAAWSLSYGLGFNQSLDTIFLPQFGFFNLPGGIAGHLVKDDSARPLIPGQFPAELKDIFFGAFCSGLKLDNCGCDSPTRSSGSPITAASLMASCALRKSSIWTG